MRWNQSQNLKNLLAAVTKPSDDRPFKIGVEGKTGVGKRELVDELIESLPSQVPLLYHHDYESHLPPANDFPTLILGELARHNSPHFEDFLKNFPSESRKYIRDIITEQLPVSSDRKTWMEDLFLQFLFALCRNSTPLFIFENIHRADRRQFEAIQFFLENVSFLPLRIIFTYDPEGTFSHPVKYDHEIRLSRLSVQEAEQAVRDYFSTSPMNARLITNHCYLKTEGHPLRIRFLLEGVYRQLIEESEGEFLNVRKLQNIRINGKWETLFRGALAVQEPAAAHLLGLFAHLDDPILQPDLEALLDRVQLPVSLIHRWIEAGFIRKITRNGTAGFAISFGFWKDWLRHAVPIDRIKKEILLFYELQQTTPTLQKYKISHLLYELEEIPAAVQTSRQEAKALQAQGRYAEAAERLYFLVRMSHLKTGSIPDIKDILEELGDLYLKMGAYENAFEILRELRNSFVRGKSGEAPAEAKRWLQVNLKMAQALIAMDAYLEARYILREIRVKKFCDAESRGSCYELLGDIEANQGHPDAARKNYFLALEHYSETAAAAKIYSLYPKLKEFLNSDTAELTALISRLQDAVGRDRHAPIYLCTFLRDQIQARIKRGEYRKALHSCYELRRLLRRVYDPQVTIQLVFYFADIYPRLGKWQLAISLLNRMIEKGYVQHRPLLLVHTYIQLGMLFKEQARYGRARRMLEKGMEICFRQRFFRESTEIQLHLGHLHLSVHGLLRAREFLTEAHQRAEERGQPEVLFLAKLYLSYYEVQQGRMDRARLLLREARQLWNLQPQPLDFLNYLFYLAFWLAEAGRFAHARRVISLLLEKSGDISRYQAAGHFLAGKVARTEGQAELAERELAAARQIAGQWNLPQVEYLALCEQVRLANERDDRKQFLRRLKETCRFLRGLTEKMEDEILKVQFLEAGQHEDILGWCREYLSETIT